ncbi:RagB/SusD family nutrient uptake outer membrane protein [Puteibacter caeruleilacunae]|nr:RagB/SusD family nutrient uptake outer membrane protein [Puteibacter caeruleilacunae]
MKKTLYIILFCACSFFHACNDYLDVVPDNVATIDNAFTDRTSAEKFLFTCYSYLPQFQMPQTNPAFFGGDEAWLFPKGSYLTASFGSTATWDIARGNQNVVEPLVNYWNGSSGGRPLWIGIRDCNIFLEKIVSPRDIEEYERVRWIAEVKTLKAFYHFYLMQAYGAIPIVDENLETSSKPEEVRVERKSIDEVVTYIVGLLDEAMVDLPDVIQDKGTELGHITKPIAAAIKAKVLVLAASPLFNGNNVYSGITNEAGEPLFPSAYSNEKWIVARDAVKEAIDIADAAGNKLYKLKNSFLQVSDSTKLKLSLRNAVTEKWNEEIIWGATGGTWTIQRLCQPRLESMDALNGNVQNAFSPTYRMAELFYTKNGVPIDEDKTWDYDNRLELQTADENHRYYIDKGYETVKLHFDREARFYSSIGFDGGIWYGAGRDDDENTWHLEMKAKQIAGLRGPTNYPITGMVVKKLVNYKNIIGSGSSYTIQEYSFPVIRLSDLYLLYAETLNESKDAPDGEVYEWLDKVRTRAGLNGVVDAYQTYSTNPDKVSSKDGMREIIQQERMIELAFEGHRFWDLRRWMRSEEMMNQPVRGWNVQEESADKFYKPVILFEQSFTQKDYLWPIKEHDLLVNTKLVQNYGW